MDSSNTIFNTITLENGSSVANVLQNITTDGLGLAPYYGYTNLSQVDVNQCIANNKFPSGEAYKETPGKDGMPGAVVITW